MSAKDGGPAFPVQFPDNKNTAPGMTLRDYFAAAAVTGYLHCYADREHLPDETSAAAYAYQVADAMTAESRKAHEEASAQAAAVAVVDGLMSMPIADVIRLDRYLDDVAAGRVTTGLIEMAAQLTPGVTEDQLRRARLVDRRAARYRRTA